MAAIDKIYVDSFEKYKLFKNWCETQPKLKDKYGRESSLIDWVFKYDEWKDGAILPVCSNPYYIDAYLIKNCPFDFIQKELMINYGKWSQDMINKAYDVVMKRGGNKTEKGEFHWLSKYNFKIIDNTIFLDQGKTDYDLIKEGKLYATPFTNKSYEIGKSFRLIQHPQHYYNIPFKCKKWSIDIELPEGLGYAWYHSNTNTWDFSDEFVIGPTSTICYRYKTIKAIKKAILKWNFPIGTIITCYDRCEEDTYKFKII